MLLLNEAYGVEVFLQFGSRSVSSVGQNRRGGSLRVVSEAVEASPVGTRPPAAVDERISMDGRCLYRLGSVRLDTRRLNNTSLLHPERTEEERTRKKKKRSAELGITKETLLGVPTSLNNFPTTAVAPYWINQRLQSKMYNQTPSLHRNKQRHRCTSCAVSSNNS